MLLVITKAQGVSLLWGKGGQKQKKQLPQAQKWATPTLLCAAVQRESGNPRVCGITVFPITSIPLGRLPARHGWGPVVSPPEHMKHALKPGLDQTEPLGSSEKQQLAPWWHSLSNQIRAGPLLGHPTSSQNHRCSGLESLSLPKDVGF